jgi:serine/threonine-protein kinase ATR
MPYLIVILLIVLQIPCIALCRACEADIPTGIDLGVAAICEDANLNSEFQRLELSIDSPQEPEADNGPPTKRRKLAEGSHLLDQITNNLYKMLGGVQTVEWVIYTACSIILW